VEGAYRPDHSLYALLPVIGPVNRSCRPVPGSGEGNTTKRIPRVHAAMCPAVGRAHGALHDPVVPAPVIARIPIRLCRCRAELSVPTNEKE